MDYPYVIMREEKSMFEVRTQSNLWKKTKKRFFYITKKVRLFMLKEQVLQDKKKK